MSHYDTTKSRVLQWIGIILVIGVFAGAYWYFQVQGSTLNQSRNDLVTNGLVGLWSFNGDDISGTTAYDRSGSGNNGTLTSGPTTVLGKVGQALNFASASSQYVALGDVTALKNSVFTWSAWINPTTYAGSERSIIGGSSNIARFSVASDGTLTLVQTGVSTIGSTTATVPLGTWSHVAVSYDASGNYVFYINGVNVKSGTNLVTFTFTGANFTIGQVSTNYFNGKIDEVRAYNRVLTTGEIQALYDQGGGTKVNSAVSNSQGTGRLDSGLAGYWALDNGSGTSATDSSSGGNTGTLNNGPTWGTGQIGGAASFDNTDDSITVGDVVEPEYITMSAWIYRNGNGTAPILTKGNYTGSEQYSLFVDYASYGTVEMIVRAAGGGFDHCRTGSTGYTTGQWYHVAGTYNGTTCRIYVNGVDRTETVASDTTSGVINGGASSLTIGTAFNGSIDEVRVYNRPLLSDEVSQLYRLTTPTSVDTSLKGYWSFNGQDISGTTAYDRSGVGNSGTLTSGPTKVKGVIGQALDFDGTDDYITITDADDTKYVGALTLCTWAKIDTGSTYNHFMGKHSGAGGSQNPFDFRTSNDAIPKLSLIRSNTTHIGWEGPVVTIGQWKHYCVTAPSTIQTAPTFYINGMPTTGTTTGGSGTGAATGSASAIRIGVRADDAAKMDGSLDEVRIYNRILTTSEIQSLYNQGNADSVNSSASQAQGTGRLDSALALYWALDDGTSGATPTSATDSSTNGNTGTLTNSPTWTTGQVGNAVDFDGTDDYITVADADIFDVLDSAKFTLSGWFNRDTFTTDDTITAKSNGQAASDTGYNAYIDDSTDKLTFVANDGTDQYKLESTSTFTATGWHHYALVWNESGASQTDLYIDGVAENATATGTFANVNSMANSVALRVGAESDAGNPFDGKLDEIRLYRRAFSSDEVANLYRLSTPTAVDTGLKGYWSFNGRDMNGTTVLDSSGTGNFGTLTNGPTRTIGKIGQAIDFDGTDDYAELADNDSLDIGDTDSLTLVGWFNRQSATTVDVILAKRNTQLAASVGYYLNLESSSDGLLFEVSDGTDEYSYESTTTFTTPGWHHFAVVWDPNSAANSEIYVDGVDDNATDTGTIGNIGDLSNTRPIAIGSNSLASGQCDCLLDEIRVYKRALSAAEIAALYNQSR